MEKDLNYWKKNAEEDYMKVPISVLRYITELENAVLPQINVIKSVCTCMAFHKSDECYKLGCKTHRRDEVQTVL